MEIFRKGCGDELLKDIHEFIEQNREYYINWLIEFCKIPSVAAQNRGMTESVNYLENLLKKRLVLNLRF